MADFDEQDAHRHFSALCFNRAWELIEQSDRTEAETAEMIFTAHASRYHWTMRDDGEPLNLAISDWQLSRVYALVGDADNAARYAAASLRRCAEEDLPPFYVGYAHEGLARAADVAGDGEDRDRHLAAASEAAASIEDEEDRSLLLADLEDLSAGRASA